MLFTFGVIFSELDNLFLNVLLHALQHALCRLVASYSLVVEEGQRLLDCVEEVGPYAQQLHSTISCAGGGVHPPVYDVALDFLNQQDEGLPSFIVLHVKLDGGVYGVEDDFSRGEVQLSYFCCCCFL